MTIKAIETRYAGCRFRSRLEARWAVFFDALDVPWEYEPQGFLVGPRGRPYLPDFKLNRRWTEHPLWVEVKGTDEALDLSLLGDAVSDVNGLENPIMLLGPVPEATPPPLHAFIRNIFGVPCMVRGRLFPALGIQQIGREYALDDPDIFKDPVAGPAASQSWLMTDVLDWPEITAAYQAARSARFEHGECG